MIIGGRNLKRSGRSAFTLIELLVVIAVVGTLIALLLPAVQAAREAARRAQCASNLRQVALAVLQYEEGRDTLPAAAILPPREQAVYFSAAYWRVDLRQGLLHNWLTQVLPFMEQQQLYAQFDFKRSAASNAAEPQAAQPASLMCPSDQAFGRMFLFNGEGLESVPFGKANVAAFASPYHVDGYDHPGAIWLYGVPMKNVIDGASDTLMLGEVRTRDDPRDQRGAWALPWAGASLLAVDMHPAVKSSENSGFGAGAGYKHAAVSLGLTQTPNSAQPDVLYECPDLVGEQIDAMPCTDSFEGYISAAPRSNHGRGANVAYLDASVRLLADDVDEVAMAYQASINDETFHGPP